MGQSVKCCIISSGEASIFRSALKDSANVCALVNPFSKDFAVSDANQSERLPYIYQQCTQNPSSTFDKTHVFFHNVWVPTQ